jgi:ABC-type glycerol-3-phosphate transport system substrate-binding protein
MNNFQTILTAIFLALFIFAVLIFSGVLKIGSKTKDSGELKGRIVVWGTLQALDFYKVFEAASGENRDLTISYSKKSASTYQDSLIEAFANDTGPDLFLITPDMILKNKNFFYKIPYTSYPEKIYRDSFIEGAEIFLDTDGIIAFPIIVDPMVMYFNKNMLTNEGYATPPNYWDELFNLNKSLTKRENSGTILSSMIALGRYDNINNSKEILSTLLLQSGNSIIKKEENKYISLLGADTPGSSKSVFETILTFVTEFSNPSTLAYSWNKTMPSSLDSFTNGKLAFYLGKGSELFKIQGANPNLSFDVTNILQTRGTNKRTYGDIYGIAINKKSKNTGLSFSVASLLTTGENAKNFSAALSLPPVLKSLLSENPIDPYLYSFYKSAIFAKSWVDPNPVTTNLIFRELFDNILSNKLEIEEAISKAQGQLSQTIK